MRVDLSGRVALVTGAGRGIGAAIAEQLLEAGADVAVLDVSAERAREQAAALREKHDRNVTAVPADVTDESSVRAALDQVTAQLGAVQILVNNAGVSMPGPSADMPVETWDQVLRVNLTGAFLCAKHCVRHMRDASWGRIVNIASFAAKSSPIYGDNASYAASKAGVVGLTHNLAVEYAAHGVTVNGIAPGIVDTDLLRSAHSEERRAELVRRLPVGRFTRPDEVAALAAFLASDHAASITGEIVNINGGLYLD